MSRLPFLAAVAAALALPLPAAAVIDRVAGPIPYASSAEIYSPGGLPGTEEANAIAAAGYVEEEYFVSGKGDVYASGDDAPRLERQGIPFTTRVLVVRPKDPRRFNGIVHLTGMHPFQGGVQWNWASHLVLDTGAAYVAVGTGTDKNSRDRSTAAVPIAGPDVTRWFNPARYAALSWPEDDGIRWTVFSDVARLLRDENRTILAGLEVRRIYSSGWSFLGSFQRTYINEGFHALFRQADGAPLIDGYLIGISSPWQTPGYLPINSRTPAPPVGSPRRQLRPIDVPVIEFLSQNEAWQNNAPQAPERDGRSGGHRLYEIGGASHRDLGLAAARSNVGQLAARGHPGGRPDPACAFGLSDVPLRLLFTAAMANLHRWVEDGTPPPPGARLQFTRAQEVARDDAGNPLGGVRSVQLDLPLARYGAPPGRQCADVIPQYIPMRRMPFDAAELARRYPGGEADYLQRASIRIRQMVDQRWLRPEDAPRYERQLRDAAAEAFEP